MSRLDQKVAIITGAGSGFGEASALLFAQEGAKVVAVDINEEAGKQVVAEIKKKGGDAIFVKGNVTSNDDWKKIIKSTIDTYGKLDILFNNAGIVIMTDNCDISRVPDDVFDKTMNVNVKGVWLGIKHAAKELVKSEGAIVNTASMAAFKGPLGAAAYATSKGAVVAMTYAVANELGLWGVRCNCISPYAADTKIGATVPIEMVNLAKTGNPLHTTINPKDVAYTALFLASDECKCINGSNYFVDAGAMTQTQPCSIKAFLDSNPYEDGKCRWEF